jgi:uncharacterized protein (DUF1501 family)
MSVVGMAAVPGFLARAAMAADAAQPHRRLVVIFQRGAADGLNIVVPHGEAEYYTMRPTIGIPQRNVIDLDGFFGLHPAMSALKPLWDARQLAIVHAAGSPDPTRSHFDAQDFMESGTPGLKSTEDGWLNRALVATGDPQKDAAFRAVALGTSLPRMLSGQAPALAVGNVNDFGVAPHNPQAQPLANTFESMYAASVDAVLHGTAQETFDAVKMLKAADPAKYRPAAGVVYPKGRFGDALKQTAQLVKANLGVQVAFTDIGGWDHHVNEGASEGQLGRLLKEFSGSLASFWQDLGALAAETVVVTMSEFGRTARENGTRGTDHGHANVMFVMGGAVRGGKVYGRWPGLANEQLYEQRDLALTTDFRQVMAEAVARQLGNSRPERVFPGFRNPGSLRLLA